MARSRSTRQLKSELLPTLGRPTMASVSHRGQCAHVRTTLPARSSGGVSSPMRRAISASGVTSTSSSAKSNARFEQGDQLHQRLLHRPHAPTQRAAHLAGRLARLRSVCASIRSRTASAWVRSSLPERKARSVNSPVGPAAHPASERGPTAAPAPPASRAPLFQRDLRKYKSAERQKNDHRLINATLVNARIRRGEIAASSSTSASRARRAPAAAAAAPTESR